MRGPRSPSKQLETHDNSVLLVHALAGIIVMASHLMTTLRLLPASCVSCVLQLSHQSCNPTLTNHDLICPYSTDSGTGIEYLCLTIQRLASFTESDLCSMRHHVKGYAAWQMTC